MVCTAEPSGVRRPPWEVLPSRRPIVQRPRADCEDDPEPGTHPSRKKGLAQGAAIRVHASILFIPTIGLHAALMPPVSRGEAGSRSRNLSEIGPRHRIADLHA